MTLKCLLLLASKANSMVNMILKSNTFLCRNGVLDENIFSVLVVPRNTPMENLYCNHLISSCQFLYKYMFSLRSLFIMLFSDFDPVPVEFHKIKLSGTLASAGAVTGPGPL